MSSNITNTDTQLKVLSQYSSELNTIMNLFMSCDVEFSSSEDAFDDTIDIINKKGYIIDRNSVTLIVNELIRLRMNKSFQCFVKSMYFVHLEPVFLVSSAIKYMNLELLKWMYTTHSYWFSKSIYPFYYIEMDGQFELIDWLYLIGYEPDSFVLNRMVISDLYENLKFLVSRGCKMNNQLIMSSLLSTNPNIFCWLIDNRCPYDKKTIVNFYQHEIDSGCANEVITEKIRNL